MVFRGSRIARNRRRGYLTCCANCVRNLKRSLPARCSKIPVRFLASRYR
ncbi:MAG: TRASH domain-containing protein [Enterobacter bugandensis]|nr:TRASH domain-containing protein [Enterobacter bugandensis]